MKTLDWCVLFMWPSSKLVFFRSEGNMLLCSLLKPCAKYHWHSSTAMRPSASCRTSWIFRVNRDSSCRKKHAKSSWDSSNLCIPLVLWLFALCWLCWLCFRTLGFAAGFVPPWTQQPAIPKPGPARRTIDALSRRNEGTRRPTKIRMSHAAHIEHRLQGKAFQSEPEYYPEYPFSYRYTSGWFETCKTFSDPLCLARIMDPIGLLQSSDTV